MPRIEIDPRTTVVTHQRHSLNFGKVHHVARKTSKSRSGPQTSSLSSQLLKVLGLRFPKDSTAIGRVQLLAVSTDCICEGIVTAETNTDWADNRAPVSPDGYARGYCGPSTIPFGAIAVSQVYSDEAGGGTAERISCLKCALQSGAIHRR